MANVNKPDGASQSYWTQTTNFWNNNDNGTVMKVIKFVGALFLYPFALLGDIATKAGQLVFGKKEEPKLGRWEKLKNHVVDAKDWTVKNVSNHKWKLAGVVTALIAGKIAYNYGLFGKAMVSYRTYVPTWIGGYTLNSK